jgi:hypothetical protein
LGKSGEQPDLQFSIRGLLWVMLGMAILGAIAGPFVRDFSPEQWRKFVLVLAIAGLGFFHAWVWTIWQHRRIERLSGQVLFSSRMKGMPPMQLLSRASVVLFTLMIVYVGIMSAKLNVSLVAFIMGICLSALLSGASIAFYLSLLLRPSRHQTSVLFCEHGIIWTGFRFVPWSRIRIGNWEPTTGRLVWSLNRAFVLYVPEADRQLVDAILRKYVSAWPVG